MDVRDGKVLTFTGKSYTTQRHVICPELTTHGKSLLFTVFQHLNDCSYLNLSGSLHLLLHDVSSSVQLDFQ